VAVKLSFLSVKGVPTLFWSSPRPHNLRPRPLTMALLIFGLALFGLGESLIVNAGVGLSPWIVLAEGVGNVTGWSIGFATFVISFAVLGFWIPLRQVPGIGTIMNAVVIAAVLDFSRPYLPTPDGQAARYLQAFLGVYVVGLGAAIYLICKLGPGPRDGLMTGLQRITGVPIAWVRSGIEVTVVVIGWWLGGTVGVGTLLFAFLVGPALACNLYLFERMFGEPAEATETP